MSARLETVASPLSGRVLALDDLADEVFAGRVVGDGLALLPAGGDVYAPAGGVVAKLFTGGHAFVVQTSGGVEVLTHIGLDTVALKGEGFTAHVREGEVVAARDLVLTVDLAHLAGRGVDLASPVVVISGQRVRALARGEVQAGAPLLEVTDQD